MKHQSNSDAGGKLKTHLKIEEIHSINLNADNQTRILERSVNEVTDCGPVSPSAQLKRTSPSLNPGPMTQKGIKHSLQYSSTSTLSYHFQRPSQQQHTSFHYLVLLSLFFSSSTTVFFIKKRSFCAHLFESRTAPKLLHGEPDVKHTRVTRNFLIIKVVTGLERLGEKLEDSRIMSSKQLLQGLKGVEVKLNAFEKESFQDATQCYWNPESHCPYCALQGHVERVCPLKKYHQLSGKAPEPVEGE